MNSKSLRILSFLIFLLVGSSLSYSQVSFSCHYKEVCSWDESREEFNDCEGFEQSSLFVINEAETMFTHTTETMKSSYFVDSKEYDKENDVFIYFVTSDVGNKYISVFDLNAKEVRIANADKGQTAMARFYVKAIF